MGEYVFGHEILDPPTTIYCRGNRAQDGWHPLWAYKNEYSAAQTTIYDYKGEIF